VSNLLASLRSTANALSVFERQLITSQNNVSNASTPGYARQSLTLQAKPFDPNGGIPGGVKAGPIIPGGVVARTVYTCTQGHGIRVGSQEGDIELAKARHSVR
jgi:flagellar hook-associated protein FlgK